MIEKQTALQEKESSLGNALLEAHQAEVRRANTSHAINDAYGKFQRGEITGSEYAQVSAGAEVSDLGVQAARKAVNHEIKRDGRSRSSIKQRLASFIMHH